MCKREKAVGRERGKEQSWIRLLVRCRTGKWPNLIEKVSNFQTNRGADVGSHIEGWGGGGWVVGVWGREVQSINIQIEVTGLTPLISSATACASINQRPQQNETQQLRIEREKSAPKEFVDLCRGFKADRPLTSHYVTTFRPTVYSALCSLIYQRQKPYISAPLIDMRSTSMTGTDYRSNQMFSG